MKRVSVRRGKCSPSTQPAWATETAASIFGVPGGTLSEDITVAVVVDDVVVVVVVAVVVYGALRPMEPYGALRSPMEPYVWSRTGVPDGDTKTTVPNATTGHLHTRTPTFSA